MERQDHLVAIGVVLLGMAGFCYCPPNFELGTIRAYPATTILAIINNIQETINAINPNVEYVLGQTATGYVLVEGIVFTTRLYIYDYGYQFCSAAPSPRRILGSALRVAFLSLLHSFEGEMVRFAASHFLAIQGEYALQYFNDGEVPPAPPVSMLSGVTELLGHDDHPWDSSSCWRLFKSTIVGGPEAVQHSTLYAGQILYNSYYYITMQADCNLIIYHATQCHLVMPYDVEHEGKGAKLQPPWSRPYVIQQLVGCGT